LWGLGLLLVLMLAVWFLCPFWFPWVLAPVASKAGARIGRYQRLGYSRFLLRDLDLTNSSVVLHAKTLNGFIPSAWLWNLLRSSHASGVGFLVVSNWDCRLIPGNGLPKPAFSKVSDVASLLNKLGRWLPKAQLLDGSVQSGTTTVGLPEATWSLGTLQTRLSLPGNTLLQNIEVKLTQAQPFKAEVDSPAGISSHFMLKTNSAGLDIENLTEWNSNRVGVLAHFGPNDILPETASIEATNVDISGDLARLPGYQDVRGSFVAHWRLGRFSLQLVGRAEPLSARTNAPPFELKINAEGDTNQAQVTAFELRAPFLEAILSNQVAISFSPPFLRTPAALDVTADLSRQKWVPLTGKLSGRVDVTQGQGPSPKAVLDLVGVNVGNDAIIANSMKLNARFEWPLLDVSSANLRFDDGSEVTLSGIADLERKMASEGKFQLRGRLLQRWLPADYSYDRLSSSGTFQGPLDHLEHSGQLTINHIVTPVVQPCDLDLRWSGQALELQRFNLKLQEITSSISATGGFSLGSNRTQLRFDELTLATNGVTALELSAPATFTASKLTDHQNWRVETTPVAWAGPAGELGFKASVQWPEQGFLEFSAARFPLELLTHVALTPVPNLQFNHVGASFEWSNSPVRIQVDLAGSGIAELSGGNPQAPKEIAESTTTAGRFLATPLNFELKLSGNEHGLALSNLVINTATSSVVAAHGSLPVTFTPATATNLVNLLPQQSLNFEAAVRPEAFFWKVVSDLTGVRLVDPMLDLLVAGTWQAPVGKVQLHARDLKLETTNFAQVSLQDLRLDLSLDRDRARLTEGQVLIQHQKVGLTAELPMGENAWTDLAHKKLPPLERVRARLLVENAELAAFEPLFPQLLAPQGNLNFDLQLFPGPRLEGTVILRRARTRPLGNTAPLRDINVTLRCHDRLLVLENATANLSGSQVNLTGNVDLRGTNWLGGALPPFTLVLRGTNVPLTREPEYIIRSDLDLTLARTNDAPALIFGTAHLRDSFYLSDLTALVSGGVATPSSRPPYFSIDNPTLANWRLAVNVDGVRWLKLRTSLFNGEASANFHLQGTLQDPIAVGVLKIESGIVRFPFANLQVQQGLVTLASEDPYHPQLLIRAASKQFGYDIRTEVSGAADSPVIQFTSNPSLSSEQILLMITSGQLPAGSFTLTPQQRAQTVALFLGRDILAKLGLGDQSQERLTISSGEEISEQGRPTYHVEYKLTKRWSLQGEYDRFGDFNAGLKWRVYSK
jgi:translocation and assembly module TamB